jgi:hypothetical protein
VPQAAVKCDAKHCTACKGEAACLPFKVSGVKQCKWVDNACHYRTYVPVAPQANCGGKHCELFWLLFERGLSGHQPVCVHPICPHLLSIPSATAKKRFGAPQLPLTLNNLSVPFVQALVARTRPLASHSLALAFLSASGLTTPATTAPIPQAAAKPPFPPHSPKTFLPTSSWQGCLDKQCPYLLRSPTLFPLGPF